MGKILLGALIGAAVAGVVYYVYHTEEVDNQLGNLKDKASDALDKAKSIFTKRADGVQTWQG